MSIQAITASGLVLNMVGTAILFFFGFPQPNLDGSVVMEFEDNTTFTDGTSVRTMKAKIKRKKLIYRTMSFIGMGLVFLGFLIQFISVIKAN